MIFFIFTFFYFIKRQKPNIVLFFLLIRYWSQWFYWEKRNEEDYGCKYTGLPLIFEFFWFLHSKAIFDLLGEDRKGPNTPQLKVDQIFTRMDVNGDGKLSKEEFITGCLQDDYLRRLLAPSAS